MSEIQTSLDFRHSLLHYYNERCKKILLNFIETILEKVPEIFGDVILGFDLTPVGPEDPQVVQPHLVTSWSMKKYLKLFVKIIQMYCT